MSEITRILADAQQGDADSADQLLTLVYEELRRLAAAKMAREAPGQTLQPTALVHEAWLRLSQNSRAEWQNRDQFYAVAAETMRRILVDRARRRRAYKHGGQLKRVELDAVEPAAPVDDDWLLQVHDALERLAAEDPGKAQIVKLRFFVGLNTAEVAALLGLSEKTIKRHWAFAKVWLARVISEIDRIAAIFVRHQHYEDAKQVYEALRASWEIEPPENLQQLESFVTATAATRGWPAAAKLYQSPLFQMSSNASALRNGSSVLLYASEVTGYRQLVRKTISLALATTNIDEQRRFAEVASLGAFSGSPDELSQMRTLLRSLEGGLNAGSTNRTALRRTIGALQLRLGNMENSLVLLDAASKSLRTGFEGARVPAVKAIALQRLGRLEEARTALAQSEALMQTSLLDDLTAREPFLRPYDECAYLVLRREARTLLALE